MRFLERIPNLSQLRPPPDISLILFSFLFFLSLETGQAQSRLFWSRVTPGLCVMMITVVTPLHSTVTLYFIIYLHPVFGCLHSTSKYFSCGLNYGIVIMNNGIFLINLTERTIILILNQSQGQNSVTTFYKFCTTILNIQSCPARQTGEDDKDRKIIHFNNFTDKL